MEPPHDSLVSDCHPRVLSDSCDARRERPQLCSLARGAGGTALEIMQPLFGPSIFQEHLDRHGEGIHHLAFDMGLRPWDERLAAFAQRGFPVSQSGRFNRDNAFAFFDTEAATGTTFETYDTPSGYVWPEPDAGDQAAPLTSPRGTTSLKGSRLPLAAAGWR